MKPRDCVVTMRLTVRTAANHHAVKLAMLDALTIRSVCSFLERRQMEPVSVEWCRTDVFKATKPSGKKGGRR